MAAGITYTPISTTTLTSVQTSISFSTISSAYTDLRIVLVGNSNSTGADIRLRFNSDTNTNYSYTDKAGYSSSAFSSRSTSKAYIATNFQSFIASSQTNMVIYDLMNYSNATTYKTTFIRMSTSQSDGSGGVDNGVGIWRSTSAITDISLSFAATTFTAGTTATLYGIAAA